MIKNDNNQAKGKTMTKEQIETRLTELKSEIKEYDRVNNDGGEGYNPKRVENEELLAQWLKMI